MNYIWISRGEIRATVISLSSRFPAISFHLFHTSSYKKRCGDCSAVLAVSNRESEFVNMDSLQNKQVNWKILEENDYEGKRGIYAQPWQTANTGSLNQQLVHSTLFQVHFPGRHFKASLPERQSLSQNKRRDGYQKNRRVIEKEDFKGQPNSFLWQTGTLAGICALFCFGFFF